MGKVPVVEGGSSEERKLKRQERKKKPIQWSQHTGISLAENEDLKRPEMLFLIYSLKTVRNKQIWQSSIAIY